MLFLGGMTMGYYQQELERQNEIWNYQLKTYSTIVEKRLFAL